MSRLSGSEGNPSSCLTETVSSELSFLPCKILGLGAQAANDMKELTANVTVLPWGYCLFCYCLDPYQTK